MVVATATVVHCTSARLWPRAVVLAMARLLQTRGRRSYTGRRRSARRTSRVRRRACGELCGLHGECDVGGCSDSASRAAATRFGRCARLAFVEVARTYTLARAAARWLYATPCALWIVHLGKYHLGTHTAMHCLLCDLGPVRPTIAYASRVCSAACSWRVRISIPSYIYTNILSEVSEVHGNLKFLQCE